MARTSKGTAVKTTPKKARKPTAPKTAKTAAKLAKRAGTGKEKAKAGEQYSCEVCGLVVSVDEACGCVETCDIVCCGEQMKAEQ